jgi:hypothetical protein
MQNAMQMKRFEANGISPANIATLLDEQQAISQLSNELIRIQTKICPI